MSEEIKIVFGLLGGLALFLFGMNGMSDALQKAAGDRMRKILAFLTRNPVMGAIAGMIVTAILQSSSATTVMVIGFVTAGLMTLPQAISVIFGANIGTTITAQLLAFQLSDYIYPIIFVGFIIQFLAKKEKLKYVGMVIFSFGLLFEGIEIMGTVMKPLANSQIFLNLIEEVKHIPVLGVLLGAGMTLVVQSSSATIAVLQNFATQAGPDGIHSVLGLSGAIPILLGDNIGTTITAILASIGQSKNAKRTAIAHSLFNISGSIVFLTLMPAFIRLVQFVSPKGAEVDIISRQIANAHTLFNIISTLIWIPLVGLMVKIVTFLIKGDDSVGEKSIRYLDDAMLGQPSAALYLVSQEIQHSTIAAGKMIAAAKLELRDSGKETVDRFDELFHRVKSVQGSVIQYISKLFSKGSMTEEQAESTAGLLYISDQIDRIADRCNDINSTIRKLRNEHQQFSDAAIDEMEQCYSIAESIFTGAIRAFEENDIELARKTSRRKNKMIKAEKRFKKAHLQRVQQQECDASLTQDYADILYQFNRIVDNCCSITEEQLDHTEYVSFLGKPALNTGLQPESASN